MAISNENAQALRPQTPPGRIAIPKHIRSPNPAALADATNAPQSLKSNHLNLDMFSPVNQNGSFEFDRVLKSERVHRRIKKKGAWKPSWKSAQLVLRPNILSLYKDEDATELWASISLSDVTAVTPVRKTNTQHVFGVFSPSKNYHFQGNSEADAADWVHRIRKEAPLDEDEQFFLASPESKSRSQNEHPITYETSDFSDAFDDRASSPEPSYDSLRARKERSRANTAQRIPSQIHEYSGNEMVTSHSDFSDSAPTGTLSFSLPRSTLGMSPPSHLPSNPKPSTANGPMSPTTRPANLRNISQISINDPAQSSQQLDPSRVIRQGYLLTLRRSSGVKSWKRLWVVLRPKTLSFYKSEAEYSLLKLFDMSRVINAAEIDPVSRSKSFCFQVILEEKTYRFACNGEEDLDAWLGALKSVLSRMKREQSRSVGADAAASGLEHSIGDMAVA
ncbi:putative ph domain protein [Phaeomoniella chlamydospora]|uniref:Putative ph domain protein n=1 Tax=Phaeomoniella chlamydospora TaxID=158046 RepID=A0A0G2F0R0_PHACM|nr:putative ph domain protein [Phaeomoniella chlamydospora]